MRKQDRLKILRLLNGYTQDSLASVLKVPRTALTMWEKGKYGFSAEMSLKLASTLCVNADYLLFGTPPIDLSVWTPLEPSRSDYLLAMQTDIEILFPQFLSENNFNMFYSDSLSDGGKFYILGRDYYFCSILIASTNLVDVFNRALNNIIADKYSTEFDHKYDEISATNLKYIFANLLPTNKSITDYKKNNVNEIIKLFNKKLRQLGPIVDPEIEEIVFRSIIHISNEYIISESKTSELYKLFKQKKSDFDIDDHSGVLRLNESIRIFLDNSGYQRRPE